jgi:hypothetical protein
MFKNISAEVTLYLQILFTLLFFALTGSVYALLRRVFRRDAARKAGTAPGLGPRLLLPVSLLAASFLAKWPALREALPLGPEFYRIYDAAFVFVVMLFIVRLPVSSTGLSSLSSMSPSCWPCSASSSASTSDPCWPARPS